jgi:hypothetical protein
MGYLLVGNPEVKIQLEIPIRTWVNNSKMDVTETGWVVLTGLIWLRIWMSGGLL